MHACPYCQENLGDLDPVMDQFASSNKMKGELFFEAECCGKRIRAFSVVMAYYIERTDGAGGKQLIGHA